MCGIAGIISDSISPVLRYEAVERMCASMVHRGPDDQGIETVGPATIGMRRLSIFDPANGHQPMQTKDGRYSIVFNGAIYNFKELRLELESKGIQFRTNCDTEVLLASFAQWGLKCLGRLRGMFAFAVWDRDKQTLVLVRDPFGIKPLFYSHSKDLLLFASEIKALSASGICATDIDPLAANDYLAWLAVPAPRTIYRNIYCLRPGQVAIWVNGVLSVEDYWSFSQIPRGSACLSQADFFCELRGHLNDSIRAHMLADVPVGAFLSGGLDSAVISGLMTKLSGTKLKTFSIGFSEGEYSEERQARSTADFIQSEHHHYQLTGSRVASDIEKIVAQLDHPTGDGINTYYVSKIAKEGGVTVALSGLGGDELFGSYPSFANSPKIARWLKIWQVFPGALKRTILQHLRSGDTRKRKLADFLTYAKNFPEVCALQRRVLSTMEADQFIIHDASISWPNQRIFHPQLEHLKTQLSSFGLFENISAWELSTYMADVLLCDSDMMSMQHSLELRVPFIDLPFIEWLWSQPSAYKYESFSPKRPLAQATTDVIHQDIMHRRKWGFTLPYAIWMKKELRPFLEDTFSKNALGKSGLFNVTAISNRWNSFLNQDDSREWSRIWSLAILVRFVNRNITQ